MVTCFVRGTLEVLPKTWKKGGLQLDETGVRWAAGMRLSGGGWLFPPSVRVQNVREVEGRERLRIKANFFQVVEATIGNGEVQLAVPRDSVTLVVRRVQSYEERS